jgi:hypothetical protein
MLPQITFPYGQISFVTLQEFLNHVPSKLADSREVEFNTMESLSVSAWVSADPFLEDTAFYKRRISKLVRGNPYKVAKSTLLRQKKPKKVYLDSNTEEALDRALTEHVEQMGTPQFFVRLSPRTWFVANPQDFQFVTDGKRGALLCFARNRCKIYKIEKGYK